jgi:hypothetical protein
MRRERITAVALSLVIVLCGLWSLGAVGAWDSLSSLTATVNTQIAAIYTAAHTWTEKQSMWNDNTALEIRAANGSSDGRMEAWSTGFGVYYDDGRMVEMGDQGGVAMLKVLNAAGDGAQLTPAALEIISTGSASYSIIIPHEGGVRVTGGQLLGAAHRDVSTADATTDLSFGEGALIVLAVGHETTITATGTADNGTYGLYIVQDGTGHPVTLPATWLWSGTPGTATATANAVTFIVLKDVAGTIVASALSDLKVAP